MPCQSRGVIKLDSGTVMSYELSVLGYGSRVIDEW
ncbi:hypothetical protein ABID31_001195 [Chryseobacterium flavum]